MMLDRKQCPECGNYETEAVHTEWFNDFVERTRICNDCPCQYTVSFGDAFVKESELVK